MGVSASHRIRERVRCSASDGVIVLTGYALPARFSYRRSVEPTDGMGAPDLDLELVVDERDGRVECRSLTLRATEPTGRQVQAGDLRISLDDVIRRAVSLAASPVRSDDGAETVEMVVPGTEAEAEAAGKDAERRRRRVTADVLRQVAEVYTGASGAPTKAVQQALGLTSYRTAVRYVKRARDEGYLDRPEGDSPAASVRRLGGKGQTLSPEQIRDLLDRMRPAPKGESE
jgi:hypothetical protein